MRKKGLIFTTTITTFLLSAIPYITVFAHEAPDEGAEWLMADWMLLSFMVFFLVALSVFAIALKRGLLTNLEQAKYYILTIDEPDYYSPDWAKEEKEEDDGANR